MIHIDLNSVELPSGWQDAAEELTRQLTEDLLTDKIAFINKKSSREKTWGSSKLLKAMRKLVGNKCWYSEVSLEGADPNIDHFRPKGQIREIDTSLKDIGLTSPGYWWLAFEYRNFRLSSMHSNQRRVDEDTEGGKWNYFPILGSRATEKTPWLLIAEDTLALDPCSVSDVSLLWFDPDGKPCCSSWRRKANGKDQQRVQVTIWLYHLNKIEIENRRGNHMRKIRVDLELANAQFQLWDRDGESPNLHAKNDFNHRIAKIKAEISDTAEYAGAKRCAVRTAIAKYEWIAEFHLV